MASVNRFLLLLVWFQLRLCSPFVVKPRSCRTQYATLHMASGKGFGRQQESPKKTAPKKDPSQKESVSRDVDDDSQRSSSAPLESIAGGAGANVRPASRDIEIDPDLPVEVRTERILRDKYGLRTYEDQQSAKKRREEQEKITKLKEKANAGKDIDFFELVPAPVLVFIDRFLKLGLGISIVLFVAAGIGITVEAWSHATGGELPDNVEDFIVNVVEPNFTPGLLVLLGFSVSLGIFAAAQLGSQSSQYSEK